MNKHVSTLLIFALSIVLSCTTAKKSSSPATIESPKPVVGGMSNSNYSDILSEKGWDMNTLNTAVSASYLNDEEKNLILAMNLVRSNPPLYADLYVKPFMAMYKNKQIHYPDGTIIATEEGLTPVRELYNELKRTKPLPPLKPSKGLSKAAASHTSYQSKNGQIGHDGQGGMQKRIEKQGDWSGAIGENISYGYQSGHEAVLSLLIDDGVKNRGHRKNILNPDFKTAGVSINTHPKYRWVHVINYAGGFSD